MKKYSIELVGVIVKINGKKKTFRSGDFELIGWAFESEEPGMSDNGIDLKVRDGKKRWKTGIDNQYFNN